MDMTSQTWPEWYDGRHINEVLFCQRFLDKHPMKCVRGRLFTVDGLIEDEGQIGNLILEEISGVLTANLSRPRWAATSPVRSTSSTNRRSGFIRATRTA